MFSFFMSSFKNLPDEISLKGVNLIIKKGVFTPDPNKTNSSLIVLNNLPKIKQKEILDMGCGSGIIGIYCALHGARKVIAVDNDEKAVENTKENVKRNNVGNVVKVIKSDLFKNVSGHFDYIFGNLPINDKSWNLSISTTDLMKKFISACKLHIKQKGSVYFTWNSHSAINPIRNFLKVEGYEFKELKERKPDKTWYLFKVQF